MKLFKRKQKEVLLEPEQKPKRKQSTANNSMLALGIALSLVSIVAASGLIGWAGMQEQQQQQQQLVERASNDALGKITHVLHLIDTDARKLAANPLLAQLILNEDSEQIAQLEQQLRHRGQVVDIYISPRGKASRQSERPAQISYAALDLIANAENGNQPPIEFMRSAGSNHVYKAEPVRLNDSIIGTLLVVYEGEILNQILPAGSDGIQLGLIQKLANTPELQIASSGTSNGASQKTIRTSHPHWQLQIQQNDFDLISYLLGNSMLMLAAAIALAGNLCALFLLNSNLSRRIIKDCNLFSQLVQNWQMGKSVNFDKIRTPELQALAASLSQTAPSRKAASSATDDQAAATSSEPEFNDGNDILALKKGQMMEVEEIDSSDYVDQIEDGEFSEHEEIFNDVLDIDILDEPETISEVESPRAQSRQQVSQSIFRAYDIRGVVGDGLNEESAYWIGRAVAAQSQLQGQTSIAVGRDGRLSSPQLSEALIQGITEGGSDVINLGLVPTPVVYFATHSLDTKSCVMVTGSHNPPEYNGFKVVINGQTLASEGIQALYQRIQDNQLSLGDGKEQQLDLLPQYLERISGDIAIARPLKVVIDCGNGAAGVIAPQLFEALGCEVINLNSEVDGNFPAHHPDPSNPDNLQQLIQAVTSNNADIGLAFDGDGDRLGMVTNTGTIIYPDRMMMLLSKDLVSRNPGADVIFDVKCSRRLAALISGYGGRPIMWKTGHSLMKAKLQETNALLAGEMSGHIFYSERWYGFDDGLYAAARLLEIIALEERTTEQIFAAFPSSKSTPELQIKVSDDAKFKIIAALQQKGQWDDGKLNDLDGVRVDYPKSWGLIRASNTTPNLVLRFEGDSDEDLQQVMDKFRQELQNLIPNFPWPF